MALPLPTYLLDPSYWHEYQYLLWAQIRYTTCDPSAQGRLARGSAQTREQRTIAQVGEVGIRQSVHPPSLDRRAGAPLARVHSSMLRAFRQQPQPTIPVCAQTDFAIFECPIRHQIHVCKGLQGTQCPFLGNRLGPSILPSSRFVWGIEN